MSFSDDHDDDDDEHLSCLLTILFFVLKCNSLIMIPMQMHVCVSLTHLK